MKISLAFVVILSCFFFSALHAEELPSPYKKSVQNSRQKINLNKADLPTLSHSVKGIGKKRAAAIIKYRDSHHGFQSIMDLIQVPGLGKQFVQSHLNALQQTFVLR